MYDSQPGCAEESICIFVRKHEGGGISSKLLLGLLILSLSAAAVWAYAYLKFVPPSTTPLPELRVLQERTELSAPGDSFSFAELSDVHVSGRDDESILHRALLNKAQGKGPLFMTFTGDMLDNDRPEQWRSYMDDLRAALHKDLPYFHIPGNHDTRRKYFPGDYASYNNYFGRTYYYVDVNDWRFIFLATDTIGLPGEQRTWLKSVLDDAGKKKKRSMLFIHCPPFSEKFNRKFGRHTLQKGSSEALARIIKNRDVAAIFAGHIHHTFSYIWNGVPVYVTGRYNNFYWVTLYKDESNRDAYKVETEVIDDNIKDTESVF